MKPIKADFPDLHRFPDDAHIEDGYLIIGDEAWTPAEFAMACKLQPEYARTRQAIYMRRYREQNRERMRNIQRRYRERKQAAA